MENLWPGDLGVSSGSKAPVTILKEQAALLGNMTKNIVEARVIVRSASQPSSDQVDFEHRFYLVAPALSGYQYRLFELTNSIELYPVWFKISDSELLGEVLDALNSSNTRLTGELKAQDERELLEILKHIFNAGKTRKVINAILAQSRGLVDEEQSPF